MNRFLTCFPLVVLGLALASPAAAQTVINTNRVIDTIACTGQDVIVNGDKAELTLTGACGLVVVNGNKTRVTIEAAQGIQVNGNKNQVTWTRGVGGDRPSIKVLGNKNVVKRADSATSGPVAKAAESSSNSEAATSTSGAGRSPDLLPPSVMAFNENEVHKTYECGGSEVFVNGNENVLNFKGECGGVFVNGNRNTVTLHAAVSIQTKGNNNQVTWVSEVNGRPPSLSSPGTDNRVSRVAE